MSWRGAVAVFVALILVPTAAAGAVRHLQLGGGDGFFVSGTEIVCGISEGSSRQSRLLLCALGNRRTRRVLPRSRLAVLSDRELLVERAPSEPAQAGPRIIFAQRQPLAAPGAPFADVPGHRHSFVLRRGDTVSIGATHIWCIDVGAAVTCSKVSAAGRAPSRGPLGISVSRTSIGVVEVTRRHFVLLAGWPLIGGR